MREWQHVWTRRRWKKSAEKDAGKRALEKKKQLFFQRLVVDKKTSAYVSIRRTSAYVSIRRTSADVVDKKTRAVVLSPEVQRFRGEDATFRGSEPLNLW